MNIYVGNLSYKTTEDELREYFEEHGTVSSARVITDKFTGRSRGFGFVDMPNDEEANKAIQETNEKEFMSRPLRVNESHPRPRDNDGDDFRR